MNFKKFFMVFLIFAVPIFAFMILSSNEQSFAKKVEAVNQPQIIKFTSLMCLDCKKLNEVMQKIYPKYADKIILTEVQVQNNDRYTNEQINKYNVSLVPTTIVIDKNGKQISRIEGFIEENDLEKLMKDLCNE